MTHDEDSDLWNQGYMLPGEDNSPIRRWGRKRSWCRPSCIPISIILILIFLVVLLPLLDHTVEKAEQILNRLSAETCNNSCSISLVESIPQGMVYPDNTTPYPSTYQTWLNLIDVANSSIEIASFYWTLRKTDIYPDPSSNEVCNTNCIN